MTRRIVLTAVLTVAVLPVALAGCAVHTTSETDSRATLDCGSALDQAISETRQDDDHLNATLDYLSRNCSDEYDVASSYAANYHAVSESARDCDFLLEHGINATAVALLEAHGRCSTSATPQVAASASWPESGLGWDEARSHAGTVQRVCGPLASVRETEYGTFVNVGLDYPSKDRFTFVLWDIYLEPIDSDSVVCGSGRIELYEGTVAQIELSQASSLELWQ